MSNFSPMFIRNVRLAAFGGALFLIALVIGTPASVFRSAVFNAAPGVNFSSIEGTVWRPKIRGLTQGRHYIGDVQGQFKPSLLMRGAVGYDFTTTSSTLSASVSAARGRSGLMLLDIRELVVGSALLERYALAGVQVSGNVVVKDASVALKASGRCESAVGDVQADILRAPAAHMGLPPIDLVGELACRDGNLSLALSGVDEKAGRVSLNIAVLSGSRYQLAVDAALNDPALRDLLYTFGFEQRGDSVVYEEIAALKMSS